MREEGSGGGEGGGRRARDGRERVGNGRSEGKRGRQKDCGTEEGDC